MIIQLTINEFLNKILVSNRERGVLMDTKEFSEWLQNVIMDSDNEEYKRIDTYEDAAILSMNDGLVVKMKDGTEYQLTVVRTQ
jgi:hypothetical protein